MNNKNRRVLVTGATGLIGQGVVAKLINQNYIVAGFTCSKQGEELLSALKAKPYIGNIYDDLFVNEMIADFKPEMVIHQITDLKAINGAANSKVRK